MGLHIIPLDKWIFSIVLRSVHNDVNFIWFQKNGLDKDDIIWRTLSHLSSSEAMVYLVAQSSLSSPKDWTDLGSWICMADMCTLPNFGTCFSTGMQVYCGYWREKKFKCKNEYITQPALWKHCNWQFSVCGSCAICLNGVLGRPGGF